MTAATGNAAISNSNAVSANTTLVRVQPSKTPTLGKRLNAGEPRPHAYTTREPRVCWLKGQATVVAPYRVGLTLLRAAAPIFQCSGTVILITSISWRTIFLHIQYPRRNRVNRRIGCGSIAYPERKGSKRKKGARMGRNGAPFVDLANTWNARCAFAKGYQLGGARIFRWL